MKQEQQLRNQERQRQLQEQIDRDREKIMEIEKQRIMLEEQRRKDEEVRRIEQEKFLREQELQRKQLEELKRQTELLSEQKKLEEEKRKRLELEEEIKRQKELEVVQKKKAEIEAKRMEEKHIQEEIQRQAMQQEIEATRRLIVQRENLVHRIVEEAKKCTIAVQYSPTTIMVSWSLGDQIPTDKDWIGFYKKDNPNKSYREYFRTKEHGQKQGNHFIRTPKTPGLYEFRFFPNGSYEEIARSDIIYIGPELEISGSTAFGDNNTVSLSWNLKKGEISSGDWIGLYKVHMDNRSYIKTIQLPQGKKSELVTIPNLTLDPGFYEFRFFPYKCGYTYVTKSDQFEVLNLDKLTVDIVKVNNRIQKLKVYYQINSRKPSNSDWIALYKKGSENNYYITYKYIDTKFDYVEFDAPREILEYEFRYHSATQYKYQDLTRSEIINIENTDRVSAEIEGGIITVNWDIHSQEKTTSDWVGLFRVEELNNKNYVQYKYVDIHSNATIFALPKEKGTYEVRYFSYNLGKYNDFRKSYPIVI